MTSQMCIRSLLCYSIITIIIVPRVYKRREREYPTLYCCASTLCRSMWSALPIIAYYVRYRPLLCLHIQACGYIMPDVCGKFVCKIV